MGRVRTYYCTCTKWIIIIVHLKSCGSSHFIISRFWQSCDQVMSDSSVGIFYIINNLQKSIIKSREQYNKVVIFLYRIIRLTPLSLHSVLILQSNTFSWHNSGFLYGIAGIPWLGLLSLCIPFTRVKWQFIHILGENSSILSYVVFTYCGTTCYVLFDSVNLYQIKKYSINMSYYNSLTPHIKLDGADGWKFITVKLRKFWTPKKLVSLLVL